MLVDHGAPELADVIAINPATPRPELHLLRCKGSKKKPGRRVGDLFEVVGQTVKSTRWVRHAGLVEEITRRVQHRAEMHQGTANALLSYLESLEPSGLAYVLYVVQPGLNVFERHNHSTDACTRLLLGSLEWLRNQEIEFRVMGWNRTEGSANWTERPDA